MAKRLILILALAFVVGIAFTAYAEVQNVKVSGDLTVQAIGRNNLDLRKESPRGGATTITDNDKDNSVLSQVRVKVDADLTDNVSTTVRLLNERTWSVESAEVTNLDVDLAYARLKEFIYSPLTLTIGRQELHFGNDMIIGDPDTNGVFSMGGNGAPAIEGDLSLRKSFDAMRATLDYNPLVVDLVLSKINEGTSVYVNDDTTLYGVNANYGLNKATTLEGYTFAKITDSNSTALQSPATVFTVRPTKGDKVYTVGGRVKNTSVKNLTAQLESAFQFGTYNPQRDINATNVATKTMQRRAWALQALATYDLKDIAKIAKYAPSLSGAYIYLSGDNAKQKSTDKVWNGWDPMYENQTFGHLVNAIMGFSNSHILGVSGSMKPVEDVTLKVDYVNFWLDKAFRTGDMPNLRGLTGGSTYKMTHNKYLGQEVDAKVTYDYTEDVQLGLLAGIFVPGNAFEKHDAASGSVGNRSIASEVIGSMKVTF